MAHSFWMASRRILLVSMTLTAAGTPLCVSAAANVAPYPPSPYFLPWSIVKRRNISSLSLSL